MLLEKFSRFVKSYNLTFTPRHGGAAHLPFIESGSKPAMLKAFRRSIKADQAWRKLGNGDLVELIKAQHDAERDAVVLLFHRVRPNAPDPTYRKKARDSMSVRRATREIDEDQSLSAHLVISIKPTKAGQYKAVLEEVPGLSLSNVMPVIQKSLREYEYDFKDRRGDKQSSYMMAKSAGVKSETIADTLNNKGRLTLLTLVKPAPPEMVDSEGIFKPRDQRLKITVDRSLADPNMLEKLENYIKNARSDGWDKFDVELQFDNDRIRTVTIEREDEARETLFVKAKEVHVSDELPVCTAKIIEPLVVKMAKVLKAA
ncbi:hypothetical protein QE363_001940 [Sphingomonas sp. SORGH_AS870]|uniref:hypothetical protein n=1 Tax=Sphingomonas sp. SORGH_AS_0870 TaxID=3041801 RepID=UPI0028545E9F|nr:hypothetical protein [Sphingomonas sp. SORGH_AS_0870]MDR6146147.1 hypothetical protein [Sphingomonas sp. SORGH_AS_0870]